MKNIEKTPSAYEVYLKADLKKFQIFPIACKLTQFLKKENAIDFLFA